jgi:hypothetical protein
VARPARPGGHAARALGLTRSSRPPERLGHWKRSSGAKRRIDRESWPALPRLRGESHLGAAMRSCAWAAGRDQRSGRLAQSDSAVWELGTPTRWQATVSRIWRPGASFPSGLTLRLGAQSTCWGLLKASAPKYFARPAVPSGSPASYHTSKISHRALPALWREHQTLDQSPKAWIPVFQRCESSEALRHPAGWFHERPGPRSGKHALTARFTKSICANPG